MSVPVNHFERYNDLTKVDAREQQRAGENLRTLTATFRRTLRPRRPTGSHLLRVARCAS